MIDKVKRVLSLLIFVKGRVTVMKDDIDSLLNSIFSNGKMSIGQAKKDREASEKLLKDFEQATSKLSSSVNTSLEQLTQDAKSDMNDLEQRLRQDGFKEKTETPNSVVRGNEAEKSAEEIDDIFYKAEKALHEKVLGQSEFVTSLSIAFKRPYVAGFKDGLPKERVIVSGRNGSGKHSAVVELTAKLKELGLFSNGTAASIDLSRYSDSTADKIFIQDLYSAIKGGSEVIVFENFEKSTQTIMTMLTSLFKSGFVALPGRYAEQKGNLIDIGSALVSNAVSTLSVAGKIIILLTESNENKIVDIMGAPFLNTIDDICKTEDFGDVELKKIAEQILKEFCEDCKNRLNFVLTFGEEEIEVLSKKHDKNSGIDSMHDYMQALYRALGSNKLRSGVRSATGVLKADVGEITASFEAFGVGAETKSDINENAVAEVKNQMQEIVGLQFIKDYILSLEDNFKVQAMRKEQGLKADFPSMHMIFTGNPGTGKTTVARIVSRYLKAIGVLSGGQLVEVSRADLVGKYVGHTAPLTQKAIESALGGVLFIDEAYALFRGNDDSFGMECIDTLVKGMEDNRDNLVVILAGYSKEMQEFMTANSGLKSRFPNIVEFPDYTAEELLAITKSIVKSKGYTLSGDCEKPLIEYYDYEQKFGDSRTNGNGRMARNKVEEAVLNCSKRAVRAEGNVDLALLLPEDFILNKGDLV